MRCPSLPSIGSLSNNDDNVNKDGKKAIGWDSQNNFACASCFLYVSLPSLHDYDMKLPNFTSYGGREHTDNHFLFVFVNLDKVL